MVASLVDASQNSKPFDDTVFEKSPWFVVLGDPGSGKTTTLKKLLLDYIEEANRQSLARYSGIPIFVPLRDFARERRAKGVGYSLLRFMHDYAKGSLSAECSTDFFEYFLEAGESLVCFDGLDEVASPEQRHEISDVVETFIRRYPRNRYIITSRVVGYNQAPLSQRIFPHYTVLPLNDKDIEDYISQWYMTREKAPEVAHARTSELIDTIMRNDRLLNLARNPLLLAIIALIHKSEADLPHERIKLYNKCSDALLTTREAFKRLEREDSQKEYYRFRKEILEAVAYWMQAELGSESGREVIVSEADLHLAVKKRLQEDPTYRLLPQEAWQQADLFVELIKERTNLLVERGDQQFAFVHLTFQEYFAASYIWRNYIHDLNQVWSLIEPHLLDPSWHEVILLLLGILSEYPRMPGLIIDKILIDPNEDKNERILRQRLGLATSCLGDRIRMDMLLQEKIIDQWVDVLRSPLCNDQGHMAFTALLTIKEIPIVQEKLRRLAENNSESSRLRCNISILYISEKMAPDWVFQTLSDLTYDKNVSIDVRRDAFSCILDLKSHVDQAWDLFVGLMQRNQEDVNLCADVLVYLDPHRDVNWLLRPLQTTQSEELVQIVESDPRFTIIFARLDRTDALPLLISYLEQLDQPTDALRDLLRVRIYDDLRSVPENYREALYAGLIRIGQSKSLHPFNADVILWLLDLGYSAEKLFDLVLEIDARDDKDEWHVDIMSRFFADLVASDKPLLETTAGSDYDNLLPIANWCDRIGSIKHLTLQISFVEGLRIDGRRTAREVAKKLAVQLTEQEFDDKRLRKLIEWVGYRELLDYSEIKSLFRPILIRLIDQQTGYYIIWRVIRFLDDRRLLTREDFNTLVIPLLQITDDSWEKRLLKGGVTLLLYNTNTLEKQATIDNLLKTAKAETENMHLKQSFGSALIRIGDTQNGAQILCDVVINADSRDGEAKDAAFRTLRTFIAPDSSFTRQEAMALEENHTL